VSCKCRLGKAITNPSGASRRIFHCLLLGLKMIVAYDLLRISSGSSNLASQGVRSNTLVDASERLQKERPSLFASMGTSAMPAIVVRRLHARGRAYRNSVLTAGDSVSQRHLALNGERAARKIYVGKLLQIDFI